MGFRYFAYGLPIDSDIELPELGDPLEPEGEADLVIRLGEVARFGTEGGGGRNRVRWIDPSHFWLHIDEVAHYRVCDGREIAVMIEPGADEAAVRLYLLGSVCGAMLMQRGTLVLHGNAIRIGDSCLVCVGDSGSGKSTLAAGFLKRGFEVLADDVVPVDDQGRVIPGFPRIKLWQDAADQLGLPTDGLLRISPDMDKYNIPIIQNRSHTRLPIRWIYLLTKDDVDDISIERIAGLSRFRLLMDNTYRNDYINGQKMFAYHLQECSRLAGQAGVSRVVRPNKGFLLNELIDRLIEDVTAADNLWR
jgi:hypothetical protein